MAQIITSYTVKEGDTLSQIAMRFGLSLPDVLAVNQQDRGHGHTAVIRPGTTTGDGPLIARAGGRNVNAGRPKQGFGTRQGLQFFVHA